MTSNPPMTKDQKTFGPWSLVLCWTLVLGAFAPGCFPKPNAANIKLRKEIQTLDARVAELETRHRADTAQIAALQSDRTVQTLPAERLQTLFTASGLQFKRLVLGADLDPSRPGDEGFKIGLTPIDDIGDEFKSAGSFVIELFDLADKNVRLGTWTLDTRQTRELWLSTPVFDGYVFTLPWQTPPSNEKLLVKATFTEELTGRSFEATSELTVQLPR
jgi:hypothetical protein